MLQDSQGLKISTNSSAVVDAINSFVEQLLSMGNNAQVILTAVEADPNCAIANAYAAALYLFSGTKETLTQAEPYLNAAKANLIHANEREQLSIAAMEAWAQRDLKQAIAYHEAIATAFKRDLASVFICQYHYRNIGNSVGLMQIAEKVFSANCENPYIYGMLAFGLEECHCLSTAEELGRRAVEMKRHNPWAHHAVAHILETQGRLEEGIAWMESVADTWENCSPAFYSHLWWHMALYYLDVENFGKVLQLYDKHIWGRARKDFAREQINAISLLLRLELRGVNVGNRWQEITAYLQPRLHEHIVPFLDLHYLYALVRSGREDWAWQMYLSMQAHAETSLPYVQKTWQEVALPAARGMLAHAKANWQKTITALGSVLPRLHETGGSHAQRDLFEQVYLDALLRAQKHQLALELLSKRAATRSSIPAIQRELALTYKKLGQSHEANQAFRRAEQLSQRYQTSRADSLSHCVRFS